MTNSLTSKTIVMGLVFSTKIILLVLGAWVAQAYGLKTPFVVEAISGLVAIFVAIAGKNGWDNANTQRVEIQRYAIEKGQSPF